MMEPTRSNVHGFPAQWPAHFPKLIVSTLALVDQMDSTHPLPESKQRRSEEISTHYAIGTFAPQPRKRILSSMHVLHGEISARNVEVVCEAEKFQRSKCPAQTLRDSTIPRILSSPRRGAATIGADNACFAFFVSWKSQ